MFLCGCLIALGLPGAVYAEVPEPHDDAYITRAVLAGDQLWLRNDQGELSTIRVDGKERVPRPTEHPVADICAFEGEAIAVSVEDDGTWVVFQPDKATQGRVAIMAVAPNDGPLLDCRSGTISIIGTQQLATLDRFDVNAVPRVVALSKPVGWGLTSAVYGDAKHLYIGTGKGEFGGGLWLVDKRTGEVMGGEDGAGFMRACDVAMGHGGCAPVNDIAALPWKSGCVVLAEGLQHMMSSGALIELCGRSFRPLYRAAYTSSWLRDMLHGRSSGETVPFYGLLARQGSLLVAGLDGLYEIGPEGVISKGRYPAFTRIGGLDVSFERSDVILVRTAASQRKALTSQTPLMIPR